MFRQVLGVIIGYAVFVVSAVLFFNLSGKDPHADASGDFIFWTVVEGVTFSFLSGVVTQRVSKSGSFKPNYVLAIIMAGFALFSFFKASGSHWTQLLAIFIFAPVSVAGGWLVLSRSLRGKK